MIDGDNSDKHQQLELVMPHVAYKGRWSKRWSLVVGVVVAAMVSGSVLRCVICIGYNLKKCLNQAEPIKSPSRRSKKVLLVIPRHFQVRYYLCTSSKLKVRTFFRRCILREEMALSLPARRRLSCRPPSCFKILIISSLNTASKLRKGVRPMKKSALTNKPIFTSMAD